MKRIRTIISTLAIFAIFFYSGPAFAQQSDKNSGMKLDDYPAIAKAESDEGSLVAEIHSAQRGAGNMLILEWSIKNNGAEVFRPEGVMQNKTYNYQRKGTLFSGASVVDETGKKRYQPLLDSESSCLCTEVTGGVHSNVIDPEEKFYIYSTYFIDSETKTVTVEILGFPEIKDVEIS